MNTFLRFQIHSAWYYCVLSCEVLCAKAWAVEAEGKSCKVDLFLRSFQVNFKSSKTNN
jgi:hypothetical protein